MKGIALVANWQKENIEAIIKEITVFLKEKGIPFCFDEESASRLGVSGCLPSRAWQGNVDLALVLGGDGTILKVARDLAGTDIPIMGINLGDMGFLTAVEARDLKKGLAKLINGEYGIFQRMMLSATVFRKGLKKAQYEVLNDVVISKGPFSRIIALKTYINNDFLERYPGDGVIIATPTGSTGYSLSAGGPIVNPSLNVIIITPICPHLLHHRSVIVHERDEIKIQVCTRHPEVVLTIDGQLAFNLQDEDEVIVKSSKNKTMMVNFKEISFYKLLHHKLKNSDYDIGEKS